MEFLVATKQTKKPSWETKLLQQNNFKSFSLSLCVHDRTQSNPNFTSPLWYLPIYHIWLMNLKSFMSWLAPILHLDPCMWMWKEKHSMYDVEKNSSIDLASQTICPLSLIKSHFSSLKTTSICIDARNTFYFCYRWKDHFCLVLCCHCFNLG